MVRASRQKTHIAKFSERSGNDLSNAPAMRPTPGAETLVTQWGFGANLPMNSFNFLQKITIAAM
jgi:hypothetical protein